MILGNFGRAAFSASRRFAAPLVRNASTGRGLGAISNAAQFYAVRSVVQPLVQLPKRWQSTPSSSDGGDAPPPPSSVEGAPKYDQALLQELGVEHVPANRIHAILQESGVTLEQLKMAVDAGLHEPPQGEKMDIAGWKERADAAREGDKFNPEMITDLNPRRRFFPGQTYSPEELSPNVPVDYSKTRAENKAKGCPLGGKRGPKIDWTNVQLLSRFITEGGKIIPKRKTNVCSKKQRELARCIKRARQMNLMPYLSKLPDFQKKEAPPIFYKRERRKDFFS
mmetsp:Transcript_12159/g.24239  ORF Transcript_12159/g.24239 Transcript_12159/m.24239 type:complete len:281 (+) Transcript_12159:142-984(+)|eukprot:CAMPEP_0181313990 /NCGR_PEP_ID=MMETSP1101-20121128/14560_1 /TAXON_ID=46948 /ORGANISM="Rhodomonas abbreviata, Strain Caron Lab Isolate" /LENGTH=280 /DNA_ID=CAMNT_0023421015 /DNA_START=135 /DNA_END=977 /DNA_ORIENTATION=-